MRCVVCGAETTITTTKPLPGRWRIEHQRVCFRGHKFRTAEVPVQMLADRREELSALRGVTATIARFHRDCSIAQDPRPAAEVASEWGISYARVRQIRANPPPTLEGDRFAKIVSAALAAAPTQKGQ